MPTRSLPPIASPSYLIGHRYQLLKKLGEGGMGVVYRAEDRLTGEIVALKRVRPPARDSLYTQVEQREALAHEFQILAGLHYPRIITVLDFGFDTDGRPFFTMNLLRNPVTIRAAAAGLSLEGKARLLVETLQALAYLHRHGIVHRDLKPSNILIDSQGELRVLDFGLAEDAAAARSSVGTLAYMAPETILEEGTTEQSDLYALGVIAYELFADRHPFDTSSLSHLIFAILEHEPDPAALTIPEPLRAVVLRLLQKAPEARYASATDVIAALQAAVGLPPTEEAALQESVLQSARFVGRETELQQLTQALEEAFRGNGSAWLIGGESGVGKTRLLAELRIHAKVRGAIVIDGPAHDLQGASHQLWGAVFRHLLLIAAVSDAQAGASARLCPVLSGSSGGQCQTNPC
jgi:serine/threonine protein kinase